MTMPILEASHLGKVYPLARRSRIGSELVAVQDLSFDLAPGGALGIVGESGAGKSSVAAMLMGFEKPTSGAIRIKGKDRTAAANAKERKNRARDIQIVFQDPNSSLDPRQRVGDSLDEVIRFHFPLRAEHRRSRVEQLLVDVGLSATHYDALPRALSGGQRQRVAIARALAAEPSILILDESVAALDVSIQAQILNLLADLRTRLGISYIFISHDLGVIRYATDTAIVMRNGEVVEQGPTSQILDSPSHPYTQMLRNSVPRPGWQPQRLLRAATL